MDSVCDKARGKFITLEGGEGVGKSTALAGIKAFLESQGIVVRQTREPGGTPLGERLRSVLLGNSGEDFEVSPEAELLVMMASRAQHVVEVIEPSLASGVWVLCDRYIDASIGYQGAGRRMGVDRVCRLIDWLNPVRPDLTLLLDAPPEVGMSRAKRRGALDRFEREAISFFERVREAYLDCAAREPARFRIIDASRSLEEVSASIIECLSTYVQVATQPQVFFASES